MKDFIYKPWVCCVWEDSRGWQPVGRFWLKKNAEAAASDYYSDNKISRVLHRRTLRWWRFL